MVTAGQVWIKCFMIDHMIHRGALSVHIQEHNRLRYNNHYCIIVPSLRFMHVYNYDKKMLPYMHMHNVQIKVI